MVGMMMIMIMVTMTNILAIMIADRGDDGNGDRFVRFVTGEE